VLLRYVSEWDPRETGKTKGGYMSGMIRGVPSQATNMVLQTVPGDEYALRMQSELGHHLGPELGGSLHPLLLHVVRMGKGKRDNDLEPVPTFYHWKQEFFIDPQRNVRIKNRTSELDEERNVDVPTDLNDDRSIVTKVRDGDCIVLGSDKSHLNLITLQPKQKGRANPGETTVSMVLEDRLGHERKNMIASVEKYFKKENSSNMKMFRLRADFYNEHGQHIGGTISGTIKDTGNKKSGSMDLYDVSVEKSCVRGGRKVFMESEYSLAKDVRPIFQVHDQESFHCPADDHLINQPEEKDIKVRNYSIHFITPRQNEDVIKSLADQNKHIVLLLRRGSDKYESPNTFEFQYDIHKNQCTFCELFPDTVRKVKKAELAPGLDNPKPRKTKRVLKQREHDQRAKIPKLKTSPAPSVSSCSSPEYRVDQVQNFPPTFSMSFLSSPDDTDDSRSPLSVLSAENWQDILSEMDSLDNSVADFPCFDPSNIPSLENEDIPIVVTSLSDPATDDINTPDPFSETNDVFLEAFKLGGFSGPKLQNFKTTPVNLQLRGDIVKDCAVREKVESLEPLRTVERKTVENLEPLTTVERKTVENLEPLRTPGRKPTQRVQPMKRNVTINSNLSEDDDEEDDDEDDEKENALLSNFPFVVVALILVLIVATPMGVSSVTAVLFTLLSLGSAALYQSVSTSERLNTVNRI